MHWPLLHLLALQAKLGHALASSIVSYCFCFLEIVCGPCSHRRQNPHFGRLGKGGEECSARFEQLAGKQGNAAWGWTLPNVFRALWQTSPSKKRKIQLLCLGSWAVGGAIFGETWLYGNEDSVQVAHICGRLLHFSHELAVLQILQFADPVRRPLRFFLFFFFANVRTICFSFFPSF